MKNILKRTVIASIFFATTTLINAQMNSSMVMDSTSKTIKAVCVLIPTLGNNVSGVIVYTKTSNGIKVVANVKGLSKGKHGFHIHECGDCSSSDGMLAGSHFNPQKSTHGSPMDMNRHTGDMGNIEADDSGIAHLEYIDNAISFEGESSVIGRSVIIHAKEDDLKTQPTGNAGARVACGVIGIGK
jgi:Cu-Zn family superoxide dismutase